MNDLMPFRIWAAVSADWQTFAALAVVALAVGALVWSSVRARKKPGAGCGGGACSAMSRDAVALRRAARRRAADSR